MQVKLKNSLSCFPEIDYFVKVRFGFSQRLNFDVFTCSFGIFPKHESCKSFFSKIPRLEIWACRATLLTYRRREASSCSPPASGPDQVPPPSSGLACTATRRCEKADIKAKAASEILLLTWIGKEQLHHQFSTER